MNRNFIRRICGVVVFCVSVSAQSQEPPVKHLGGHSLQGEVFNEGPRQAARIIEASGAADFPLSSSFSLAFFLLSFSLFANGIEQTECLSPVRGNIMHVKYA